MTSTDIVKWRKTNDYENFEKGMIMKILKKEWLWKFWKKGGRGSEIHALCACASDYPFGIFKHCLLDNNNLATTILIQI